MSPIGSIGTGSVTPGISGLGQPAGGAARSGFGDAFKQALDKVSSSQKQAEELARRFQLNDPQVSLEETMVAGQTANLQFQMALQVRNKVVAAYQDIMNMQV